MSKSHAANEEKKRKWIKRIKMSKNQAALLYLCQKIEANQTDVKRSKPLLCDVKKANFSLTGASSSLDHSFTPHLPFLHCELYCKSAIVASVSRHWRGSTWWRARGRNTGHFFDRRTFFLGSTWWRSRNISTGDLNFTSTQRVDPVVARSISEQSIQLIPPSSKPIDIIYVGTNPFASSFDRQGVSSAHTEPKPSEAQSAPPNLNSGYQEVNSGEMRKKSHSHVTAMLGNCLDYKKSQTDKTMEALNEKKRHQDDFSVENCIDTVDAIEELAYEKLLSIELFQSEMNRQIFMKMKNHNVPLIWLKRKIRNFG